MNLGARQRMLSTTFPQRRNPPVTRPLGESSLLGHADRSASPGASPEAHVPAEVHTIIAGREPLEMGSRWLRTDRNGATQTQSLGQRQTPIPPPSLANREIEVFQAKSQHD